MTRKRLFQVTDPQGRGVVFHADTWKHIKSRHPELSRHQERIRTTVMKPDYIFEKTETDSIIYVDSTLPPLNFNVAARTSEEFEETPIVSAWLSTKLSNGDLVWSRSAGKSSKTKK